MQQSLYTSELGIMGMQLGIDVLANNIANINTHGYKKSEVTFQEMLQMNYNVPLKNINPKQKGLGVLGNDIRKLMNQGTMKNTNISTDLAIMGDGYFVLNRDGQTLYSRVGNFKFDPGEFSPDDGTPVMGPDGDIYYLGNPELTTAMKFVNPVDGAILQGWMADSKGNINTDGKISNIEIDESMFDMQPRATSYVKFGGSIDERTSPSNFNQSILTELTKGSQEITADNLASEIRVTGSALNKESGKFEITIEPDGSAKVKSYLDSNLAGPVVTEYAAGTIPTTVNSNGVIPITSLIPGMNLELQKDITAPVKLTVSNTGENIGDQFTAMDYVYDSQGNPHTIELTFTKTDTNEWKWKADLINEEYYQGTGNAQTFALKNDINLEKPVTITAADSRTGVSRTLTGSQYDIFEGNKITSEVKFEDTELVTIKYTDKNTGNAVTENFSAPERRQTFLLDKAADPDSVLIFVDNDTKPLDQGNYKVVDNMILPVDLDGDNKSELPFIYPGADIKIRYKISEAMKTAEYTAKDEFQGNGEAQDFKLSEIPDPTRNITLTVNDINGNQLRTLNSADYNIEGNILKTKDTDSSAIKSGEYLTAEYTPYYEPVTLTETKTSEGAGSAIEIHGEPDPATINIKVNGEEIDSSQYLIGGNKIYQVDTDNDGITDSFGPEGSDVEITYSLDRELSGKLSFDSMGKVSGGTRNFDVTYKLNSVSDPLTINIDLNDIMQTAGYADVAVKDSDGNAEGFLKQLGFEDDGTIRGFYSNDITQKLGKIALATFNNPAGLFKADDNYYKDSVNAGSANITTAGPDTVGGTIHTKTLEMSNVDLAESLSQLIVLQRSFQLNSKGVSTTDDMIREAISMKRY